MLHHAQGLAASPPVLYKLIVGGAWRLLFFAPTRHSRGDLRAFVLSGYGGPEHTALTNVPQP